jgi:hypothetical protein
MPRVARAPRRLDHDHQRHIRDHHNNLARRALVLSQIVAEQEALLAQWRAQKGQPPISRKD